MKKRAKWLAALISAIVLFAAYIISMEKLFSLIFQRQPAGKKDAGQNPAEEKKSPLEGMKYREYTLYNSQAHQIKGRVYPASHASRKFVILSHGYRSQGLDEFESFIPWYVDQNVNVLVIDHQSHGKSQGDTITFGLQESRDLLQWIHFLNQSYPNIEIFLHGISMGAATVLQAVGSPELDENVKFFIEDCGYDTALRQIHNVFNHVGVFPPLFWLSMRYFSHKTGQSLKDVNGYDALRHAKIPGLFIHGMQDDLVDIKMGVRLFDSYQGKKDFLFVEHAGHAQAWKTNPEAYQKKILAFMDQYLG